MNDYEALRGLLQHYARAADDRDVDALAALFHPQATVDGARGMQTITEWLDTMQGPSAYTASMHVLADPLIELAGDDAHLDTYAVVYQIGDPSTGLADLTLGIRYLDHAVRHDGTWVIRARVAQTRWMRNSA